MTDGQFNKFYPDSSTWNSYPYMTLEEATAVANALNAGMSEGVMQTLMDSFGLGAA